MQIKEICFVEHRNCNGSKLFSKMQSNNVNYTFKKYHYTCINIMKEVRFLLALWSLARKIMLYK